VPSPPHLTPPLIPQPPAGGSLSTETGGRFGPKSAIGVDEIFWRKHHHYLTLVTDHRRRKVVWGASGREATTLDGFFEELGPGRAAQITAVSMDMEPAFGKSVRGHAPQASICIDPFNVVALGTQALDEVRRPLWQELRSLPDPAIAKKFKGARWALLKKPEDLTTRQAQTLTAIRRGGGRLWRMASPIGAGRRPAPHTSRTTPPAAIPTNTATPPNTAPAVPSGDTQFFVEHHPGPQTAPAKDAARRTGPWRHPRASGYRVA
jgi:hypothetical protein